MHDFRNVSEFFDYCTGLVANDSSLSSLSITGEISGLKVAMSGHCYFTLKDADRAQVSCVMFASYFRMLNFEPTEGMKVTISGCATFYPARGAFQLKVMSMSRQGKGDLKEQLKRLYNKLYREGIFDDSHKKALPVLPRRIGVITSAGGAVIHDIINTLNDRNPYFDLLLYPSAVQGEECPREVIEGLDFFETMRNVDVIIIARGGGSVEDLWGYNDEALVRRVFECDIPVISAIGHETDYTLCDYAADVRALTPTYAAQVVMPEYEVMHRDIERLRENMHQAQNRYLEQQKARVRFLREHRALHSPMYFVQAQKQRCDTLLTKLKHSGNMMLMKRRSELEQLSKEMHKSFADGIDRRLMHLRQMIDSLDMLSPTNVLRRGYSYVHNDKGVINSVSGLKKNDTVDIVFCDGEAKANIVSVKDEV